MAFIKSCCAVSVSPSFFLCIRDIYVNYISTIYFDDLNFVVYFSLKKSNDMHKFNITRWKERYKLPCVINFRINYQFINFYGITNEDN